METVSTMGSGFIGRELDLEAFVLGLKERLGNSLEAKFTSEGMVTIRLEDGGPAYTIYRTGTFQIRGAKSKDQLKDAADRFRDLLSDLNIKIPEYEFQHVTSVFLAELSPPDVNLEVLSVVLGLEHVEYEPEQFPGLIYRPPNFDVTLLIFASGKVIVVGSTDQKYAQSVIQRLEEELPN